VTFECRINQRSRERTDHCRRFVVSTIVEDVKENFCALPERRKKRWIAFTQGSYNAEREGFRTHLDL